MSFLQDLGVNLLADAIFTVIIGGLLYRAARRVYIGLRGKDRRDFFGTLSEKEDSVRILLSNIVVKKGGSLSVTKIRSGSHGSAINLHEYEAALLLASKIEAQPLVGLLRRLTARTSGDALNLCRIGPAPAAGGQIAEPPESENWRDPHPDTDEFGAIAGNFGVLPGDPEVRGQFQDDATYIFVGSPVYNGGTEFTLRTLVTLNEQHYFHFFAKQNGNDLPPDRGVLLLKGTRNTSLPPEKHQRTRQTDTSPGPLEDFFIVQKIAHWNPDPSGNGPRRTAFICAGTCTAATYAAVETLATEWPRYLRDYGTGSFATLHRLLTKDRECTPRTADIWEPREIWHSPLPKTPHR